MLLMAFLILIAFIALLSATLVVRDIRAERRRQRDRERPATLEGAGSHLTVKR